MHQPHCPTLAAGGVTAVVMDGQLAVTGEMTSFVLDDPGLSPEPIAAVSGLSPAGGLLAAAALALLAGRRLRPGLTL